MIEMKNGPTLFDFDRLAAGYDGWYESPEGKRYDKLEKKALRRLFGGPKRGATLLEVGMGTGWWSRFFSELGFVVTGIDISPMMVAAARSKRIPNAAFGLADAHDMPFEDGRFSVSAAITTIEFTGEPESVIREMVRCTKPGGILVFGVLNAASPINRRRRHHAGGPFHSARFFTMEELHGLLSPYGDTVSRCCAFPLSMRVPAPLAQIADDGMASMKRKTGAFIAIRTERSPG